MKKILVLLLAGVMLLGNFQAVWVKADDDDDDDKRPATITRLSHSSRTVRPGTEFELKAYVPDDSDDDALVWYISNTKVVRFDDDDRTGDEMEFKAGRTGTAYITCKIKGTNIYRRCKVKVTYGKARITVDDSRMEVEKGDWEDIEARLVGGKYKNRRLSYYVSKKHRKIIRVKKGKVYGRRVGRAKITIRAKANGKIKKVVYVRVERDD